MGYKMNIVLAKGGYQMRSTILEDLNQPMDAFSIADGFNFAVSVVSYPDFNERLDPTIATIQIIARSWGKDAEGISFLK